MEQQVGQQRQEWAPSSRSSSRSWRGPGWLHRQRFCGFPESRGVLAPAKPSDQQASVEEETGDGEGKGGKEGWRERSEREGGT